MSVYHWLLTYSRIFQRVFRGIAVKIGLLSPNRLRVVVYHDIPLQKEKEFAAQLSFLQKNWKIISPYEFEKMFSGEAPIKGDNLLITFDDGFYSNYIVAEKFLNPMGIKAIFFIISDFAKIKNLSKSHQFIAKNITPSTDLSNIPTHCKNMQWRDLSSLIKQGHTIGCHTKTHARLSKCVSDKELQDEILSCSSEISNNLNIKVRHFAYPFGNVDSFSKSAYAISKQAFPFIHSGVRGKNRKSSKTTPIFRDAAGSPIFNNSLLSSFLDGFVDFKYRKARNTLRKWSA